MCCMSRLKFHNSTYYILSLYSLQVCMSSESRWVIEITNDIFTVSGRCFTPCFQLSSLSVLEKGKVLGARRTSQAQPAL